MLEIQDVSQFRADSGNSGHLPGFSSAKKPVKVIDILRQFKKC